MDAVLVAQLDALDAQIELLKVQAQGLRHRLASQDPPPTARIEVPERCREISSARCALQNDEARVSRGSFAHPNAWQCLGCRYRDEGPSAVTRSTGD